MRVEKTMERYSLKGADIDDISGKIQSELPKKLTLNKLALIGKAEKSP